MRLVRATLEDNDKLTTYFKSASLPGAVDLSFERKTSFFNQYRLQSDDFTTYVLLGDQDTPEAMASLVFRRARIEGNMETICIATDLRVSPSRGAVLSWSQHFLPILEREKEKRQCRYVFSVVAQNQKQAYNAFVRPRSMKRKLPRYFLFRRFQIVSLHGMWPLRPKPLPSIRITSFQESDRDALIDYLLKKKAIKPLCFSPEPENVVQYIDRWEGLKWDHFILAKDNRKNILGCTAKWSPSRIQTILPVNYSPQATTLKEGLHLLSFLGVTKQLPPLGQPLEFSFLTHLFAENPDIFYSLLENSYRSSVGNEILVYTHFDNYWLTTPPRGFISATIPGGFYCMLSPEQSVPDFLKPTHLYEPPDFELAYW
jgi:hypothetical protein